MNMYIHYLYIYRYIRGASCLHVVFSVPILALHLSALPSRYRCSPSCKASFSEPQPTPLSGELGTRSFFKILAFTFLAFSKLCLSSILFLSFKNCRAFSDGFSRASFLQCPDFLGVQFSFGFPSLSFSFSAISMVFENFLFIFVHTHCLC